jgi:TatA/E family protein of Tat protein translocase
MVWPMGKLGMMELMLILLVLLLLFGATRLPQLGSSLGSAIRNFKKGFGGEEPAEDAKKPPNLSSPTRTTGDPVSGKSGVKEG